MRRGSLAAPVLVFAGGTLAFAGLSGRVGIPDWLASRLPVNRERAIAAERVVTILSSPEDLMAAWRHFEHLPHFMRAPDLVDEDADGLIRWHSPPNERTRYRGAVRFDPAPEGRGTEVRVSMQFEPAAGAFGAAIAWVQGDGIDRNVREGLRAFKQFMEAGEIATNDGQPMGTCAGRGERQ